MSLMAVGATRRGHSLPGELRARAPRGTDAFGPARLRAGMSGFALGDVCDPTDPDYDPDTCTATFTAPPPSSIPVDTSVLAPTDANGVPTTLGDQITQAVNTGQISPQIIAAAPGAGIGAPAGYSGPSIVGAGAATPSAPSGYQWAQLASSTGNVVAKVLAVSNGQGVVTLPNGMQVIYPQGSTPNLTGLTGSGAVPFLLVAGVGVLVLMMSRK